MLEDAVRRDDVHLVKEIVKTRMELESPRNVMVLVKHLFNLFNAMQTNVYTFLFSDDCPVKMELTYLVETTMKFQTVNFKTFRVVIENDCDITRVVRLANMFFKKRWLSSKRNEYSREITIVIDNLISRNAGEILYIFVCKFGTVHDLHHIAQKSPTKKVNERLIASIIRWLRVDLLEYVCLSDNAGNHPRAEKLWIDKSINVCEILTIAVANCSLYRKRSILAVVQLMYDNRQIGFFNGLCPTSRAKFIDLLLLDGTCGRNDFEQVVWFLHSATKFAKAHDNDDADVAKILETYHAKRLTFFKHVVDNNILDADVIRLICHKF